MLAKLLANADRYGWAHACAAYVGRKSPRLWRLLGPRITRRYLDDWLGTSSPALVNLGSGSHLIEGMLNVDVSPRADAFVDLSRRLPFADCTLDGVFCEEVIEHLPFDVGRRLLAECHRCLKPGASIRLSTPDLNHFLALIGDDRACNDAFLEGEADSMLRVPVRDRSIRRVAMVNAIFYRHDHRFLFDAAAVSALLADAGFERITRSRYRDPESALAVYDSHAERYGHAEEMSLYVEAAKPAATSRV